MPALELPPGGLCDDVVRLRPWTGADLAGLLAAFGDPLVQQRSWSHDRPYGEQDARAFLAALEPGRLAGEQVQLAVVDPADGSLCGGASLYDVDEEHRRAAVGYWLTGPARGRGRATAAVRLLVRWAFDDLRLARLELTCDPDNTASRRVAERCGFTVEGRLRSHLAFRGQRRDTLVHGLLAAEVQRGEV